MVDHKTVRLLPRHGRWQSYRAGLSQYPEEWWSEESPIGNPDQEIIDQAGGDGKLLLQLWLGQSGLIREDGKFFFRMIPNTPHFLVTDPFPDGAGLVFVPDLIRRMAGLPIPQVLIMDGHVYSLDAVDNSQFGDVKDQLL